MISLEHIRTLEARVNKAVATMTALQEENTRLKALVVEQKARIEELEFSVEEFREDQSAIEEGIMQALHHLDNLENAVGGLKPTDAASEPQPQETMPAEAQAYAEPEPEAPVQAPAPVEPPMEVSSWDAPEQRYDEPAPAEVPAGEEAEAYEENQPAPRQEQQLDIF